ncbi:MarR family winged helix-turn-helix transcriptional regulator [Streptomyces millisiae]|uniref:MarR family transcriptional regulator n=1 Tax=Streptomyces millisiae TaxID=3075542 RepID=A0ABU2LJ43_9ACTN|nr:MarR family transcriptional regulator [Streptomyces sp. DSM 44918]MDT0317610.1 MarR family transcriptional regulator [Streptomyces sp. DSM 44918]
MESDEGDAERVEELVSSLMAAARLMVGVSARALARVDETLSLAQLRSLVVLDACAPAKLAVLARALGVNPSTALRTVARLETAGLVDRRVNEDNRREVVLTPTAAGRDLVARVLDQRRREMATLADRLPAEHRRGLVDGLRALLAVADEPDLWTLPRFADVVASSDDGAWHRSAS